MEVNTAPVNAFIYFDKLIKIQFVAISFLYFAHCCFDYYNVIATFIYIQICLLHICLNNLLL